MPGLIAVIIGVASQSASDSVAPDNIAASVEVTSPNASQTESADGVIEEDGVEYYGLEAEEFDMAQKNLLKNIPESKINNSYWLRTLMSYETYGVESVDAYENAVNSLTAESVKAVVAEILAADNHAELVMRPGNTAEAE